MTSPESSRHFVHGLEAEFCVQDKLPKLKILKELVTYDVRVKRLPFYKAK